MPAPLICEGAIRTCFGRILGFGAGRFRRSLCLVVSGGGSVVTSAAASVSAVGSRDCNAVILLDLLVLQRLIVGSIGLRFSCPEMLVTQDFVGVEVGDWVLLGVSVSLVLRSSCGGV